MKILDLKKLVLTLEIEEELENEAYLHRTHGSPTCYAKYGCRGPICVYGRAADRRRRDKTKPTMHPELLEIIETRYKEYLAARKTTQAHKETA